MFSLIHDHEKEQRLRLDFFLKNPKRIRTCDKCVKKNQKHGPLFQCFTSRFFICKNQPLVKLLEN
jgi:hypothetical protein